MKQDVRDATTETYEYIIVGSGSSGAVVAARLSEDPKVRVLLLEAGPADRNPWLHVPLGFAKVHFNKSLGWGYETEPEPELGGRRIFCSRGKVLGGSSAINGLVYVRGAPLDYAIWRQLGAAGWAYDDVLPFYKKAERQQQGADAYHGADGPLGVENTRWRNGLADAFINSAINIGIPRNDDFNGKDLEGAGYYQLTTWKGRRSSSAMAYLYPARGRSNLNIVTNALVTRIEMENGRATAVSYERGGKQHRAVAGLEIILSAGSFNSPQLLQLSGIGPADLLRRHGIEVKLDLPGVGENMSDHVMVSRIYSTTHHQTVNAVMRNFFSQAKIGLGYLLTRKGPLSIGAVLAGGYARTEPVMEEPDIQFFFAPFAPSPTEAGKLARYSGFILAGNLNRPASRGHVRIRSRNPREKPAVVANYLTAESDMRGAVAIMRLLGRIADEDPLRNHIIEEVTPSKGAITDDEMIASVRALASTGFHHVGTCRMGSDDMAVVDPTLKLLGIRGLRVADGSVMPTVVSANTNAACVMIGEKAAYHIRQDLA